MVIFVAMTGRNRDGWGINPFLALGLLLHVAGWVFGQTDELPDKPDLIRVTVDHSDNGVLIQWEPSEDRDIAFYHLYRMENGTGQKIASFSTDTLVLQDTLSYKHFQGGTENLAYTVTAEDSMKNESLLEDNVHMAVSLSVIFDPCKKANTLSWTGYVGWEGKISGYKVMGSVAGETPRLLKFVHASTRSFLDGEVEYETTYHYYIETVHTSGMTSLSAVEMIHTSFPDPPDILRMDYVSLVEPTVAELKFTAGAEEPVNHLRILRKSSGESPYTEVETLWDITDPVTFYSDPLPALPTSYRYIVQALYRPEGCTDPIVVSESNPGTTILLTGSLEGQRVTLSWTPYETYPNGLAGYIVQRKSGEGEFIDVQILGESSTTWEETIRTVVNGYQPGNIQYRIIARGNPVGDEEPAASVSNIVGVAVETHLQVPSAFTPGSNDMNFEFRPILDFAPRDYTMIIFDRVGRKLFETTDPGLGWDGSFQGGEKVMEGVYVYFIRYTDFTGISRSLSGNVTVLYP